ncbi:MAG: ATP synthase F1 subunit epsilon [Flavobacteriaceae bacterium]|nr:ATP synthase F1 subunit epsilon [Flavobacteriaceae bacterium]
MNVDIITPDENLFTGEASSITVPGSDGSLGILDNHAALISSLKEGQVKLTTTEGEKTFVVNGGVIEVLNNKVIILAG